MAKVSLASKDMYDLKTGPQEGWYRIEDAKVVVAQYPPNKETGEQQPPFTAADFVFTHIDEKGNPVEDVEPQHKLFPIDRGRSGSLKMHPGNASSRDDEDPEDLGTELGTEGNTIYAEPGVQMNTKTGFAMFTRSLEEAGFKPDILGAAYMPDFIGLEGYFKTIKGEKTTVDGRAIEPAYFVAERITRFPYEAPAKKPAAKAAAPAKANGLPKPNGIAAVPKPAATPAPAPATAAATTSASSTDAEEVATTLLAELNAELAGESRESKKVYSMAFSRLVKDKDRDKKLDKAVTELLKSEDWLTAKAEDLGYQYADGVFTFAEAS